MACVVGPTDAGMSKFDKGNIVKVYEVWSQRINKELEINVSTDRNFRVGHKPSIMAEKVNNWDPRNQRMPAVEELDKVNFQHPPIAEITDPKYLGVEAFPRERFDIPQSEYHKIGWMDTPAEFRSGFANLVLGEKRAKETGFSTGLLNKRDTWFRTEKKPLHKNPMAHHTGYITGLADNPYERTIKHPDRLDPSDEMVKEWKTLRRREKKERKRQKEKMRSKSCGAADFSTVSKTSQKSYKNETNVNGGGVLLGEALAQLPDMSPKQTGGGAAAQGGPDEESTLTGSGAGQLPARTPSILSVGNSELKRLESKQRIFDAKVENVHSALLTRYARLRSIGAKRRWFKPLSNSDVSLFADAYSKQMLCGPFMKTQVLVSR